jgi:FxsC-like protein
MALPGSLYFYLSYAKVPPVPGQPPARRDGLVHTFFTDLSASVGRLAHGGSRQVGLYDGMLDPGADEKAAVRRGLGQAEVLVPLCSDRYASSDWTARERRSFSKRMELAHADPAERIKPVLWLPGEDAEQFGLRGLDDDIPLYKELGLGGLCHAGRLDRTQAVPELREAYQTIVDRVADRVVRTAERTPIGPSVVPGGPEDLTVSPATAAALIAVYQADGTPPEQWAPYSGAPHDSITQHALGVAQRLDIKAAVVTMPGAVRLWQRRPAVLLIDAWLADSPERLRELIAVLRALPRWALPLMITDRDDRNNAERVANLRTRVLDMLDAGGAGSAPPVADHAASLREILPGLLTQARSRYLHDMPKRYPKRPRLGTAEPQRRPAKDERR